MGLDSVEILMKVESSFGIQIPRREVEQISTVGDLYDAVWKYIGGKKYDAKCKSQALFYKLRKAFKEHFNFPPLEVSLSTSPDKIFPVQDRRSHYHSFSQITNLLLPPLVLTEPWLKFFSIFGLVIMGGGLVTTLTFVFLLNKSNWFWLLPVAGIILTVLLTKLLESKRTRIEARTMRSFTEEVLSLNYASMLNEEGTNRKEMELVINYIISDMAGLELEEITPEKRIADDLGID